MKATPEPDNGRLVYRARSSTKRIPYAKIKKRSVKKNDKIVEETLNWLFG